MSAKVVQIDWPRSITPYAASGASQLETGLTPTVLSIEYVAAETQSSRSGSCVPLSPKQLYPDLIGDAIVFRALSLVEQAQLALKQAVNHDPAESFFLFDQEIMKARAYLISAYRFRAIGDGYAAIINAIIWALANRVAGSPNRRQINAIATSLTRLSEGPYLHFDTAMQVMDSLEDVDLDIEPEAIDMLTDQLDD